MLMYSKAWLPFTANSTTTTQKQSDYVVERSSFPLIVLFCFVLFLNQNWSLSWSELGTLSKLTQRGGGHIQIPIQLRVFDVKD